ncbi:hypothetical protein [Sphingosinicella sp. BN140058]|uniref:hypothetical protein n=1 Tax=Sphingosinicella sp. BN140058 TaxID=1892855 RepID=UPI001013328B|nr:hypothetical protein [Sphingosinicella sp. BN140058]QAY76143.1 hypothetical protein ETR14_06075 [Sphingosinicella sp. BN140058]
MARKPTGKAGGGGGLKAAIENHPLLVIVSALSLLINAGVGAHKAYAEFFGERALLSEQYLIVPARMAEQDGDPDLEQVKRTGRLEPYKCGILDNELRTAYLAAQGVKGAGPARARLANGAPLSREGSVVYIVIRNDGAALARDVVLRGQRLANPFSRDSQGPAIPAPADRGPPDYEAFIGISGVLGDASPGSAAVKLGALKAGECIAVPVAFFELSGDEDPKLFVSRPVYVFDRLDYRRSFGWTSESQKVRPVNNVAVTVDSVIKGLG